MIAAKIRTREAATGADLQIALGTCHVFHLPMTRYKLAVEDILPNHCSSSGQDLTHLFILLSRTSL